MMLLFCHDKAKTEAGQSIITAGLRLRSAPADINKKSYPRIAFLKSVDDGLHVFNHQGRSAAAAVADACCAVFGIILFQDMDQGYDYAGTGSSQRMT